MSMRVTSWLLVVCAVLGATGVLMPAFELDVHGWRAGRRGSLSLYQAHQDRDFVRRVLAAYRHDSHRRELEQLTGAQLPAVLEKAHLDDARDAMTSLDAVGDDDLRTADRFLAIGIWTFVLLQAVTAGLVFVGNVRGHHRTGDLLGALIAAVVTAAAAIAIHVGCRQAVWEANDDLGYPAFGLGIGAYLIPLASIGSACCAVALLVQRRRLTATTGTPSA